MGEGEVSGEGLGKGSGEGSGEGLAEGSAEGLGEDKCFSADFIKSPRGVLKSPRGDFPKIQSNHYWLRGF